MHEAYQRQGSKLRSTVRTINNVKGASTTFQKVGKGTASTKSTHEMVPVMNLDHSNVECVLEDYYADDWVDRLDELKININEHQVIANAGANALGRKTDEMIINALYIASTNIIADANTGLIKAKVLEAFETFGDLDVPDGGQRFVAIGWKQWSDLLQTDSERAVLTYIFRPDESEFPPYFDQALIVRLAAEFCIPVTENTSRTEALFSMAEREFARARQIDAQQDTPNKIDGFTLVDVR